MQHWHIRWRRALLVALATHSVAGKSMVVAGLCRCLTRKGFWVALFKAQNMSEQSQWSLSEGGEIGRAQAMQRVRLDRSRVSV